MDGESSTDHTARHQVVMALRQMDMSSVVVVQVRSKKLKRSDCTNSAELREWRRQTRALTETPPTPDGLDYLITIDEDEQFEPITLWHPEQVMRAITLVATCLLVGLCWMERHKDGRH